MNRLNLVTLGVRDYGRSIAFYREGLGFKLHIIGDENNPGVVFFNNQGSKISLFQMDELAKDIHPEAPPVAADGFSGITLAYNAKSKEEVDEIFRRAEKAGAKITKNPVTVFWGGYSGYFQDPDGHYWEVAYGEDWEFDENDMLIIEKD